VLVVRRKDLDDAAWSLEKSRLASSYGASLVLSEEEVSRTPPKRLISSLRSLGSGRVPLLLDAVGGKVPSLLALALSEGATCVTYGGLSRQATSVRAGTSIFQDVSFRGFWLSRWTNRAENRAARVEMLGELARMAASGALKLPQVRAFQLEEFEAALGNVGNGEKTAFDCDRE
jgi:NADPH:quinone reductase-like Zn-dependent oxidoreductase